MGLGESNGTPFTDASHRQTSFSVWTKWCKSAFITNRTWLKALANWLLKTRPRETSKNYEDPLLSASGWSTLACNFNLTRYPVRGPTAYPVFWLVFSNPLECCNLHGQIPERYMGHEIQLRGRHSYNASWVYEFRLGQLSQCSMKCWWICLVLGIRHSFIGIEETKNCCSIIVWSWVHGCIQSCTRMYLAANTLEGTWSWFAWGNNSYVQ